MKLRFILRCGLFSFLCLWCVGILYFVCWDQKDFWPAVSLNYTDKTRNNINTTDQHVPNYMFWSNEHVNKEEEKVDEGVNHHLLACHLPTRQAMPLILSLQHPQRPFHGNHWFHFGEYYLSQRRYLQAHLVTHISSVQFNHIYIVTIDKKIFQMATSFTFFLLLLTLPSEYQQLPVSFVYTTDDLHLLDHHQPWSADSTMERFCPFQKVQVQKESFHFQNGIITASTSNKFKAIEGYYIGSIGSVPISSTEWFRNQDEVASLRTSLQSVCAVDTSTSTTVQGIAAQGVAGSKAKVVIYQRNEQRKLLNLIETFLQSNQSQYSILRDKMDVEVIVHDENRDPCSLCNALQHADVLITSHGFQLTGLFCLPPKSLLIEIFPYKYFKSSYFHLARSFGIEHRWFQAATPTSQLMSGALLGMEKEGVISLEACMKDQVCRSYARSLDIELTEKDLNAIANVILSFEPRSLL